MRNYIISEEASSRIADSTIGKKVEKYNKRSFEKQLNLGYTSLFQGEINSYMQELGERGYYKTMVGDFKKKYFDILDLILKGDKTQYWNVSRDTGEVHIKAELNDIIPFLGVYPAEIMTPSQIWNFNKFGFNSVSDFVSSVSVYMMNIIHPVKREGREWTTHKDGKTFKTVITGDNNGDFCLYRDDISAYPTINPFGDISSIRPQEQEDRLGVFGFHSMESAFLASILKWIDQCNIKSDLLDSGFDGIIAFLETVTKNTSPFCGAFTEQIGNNSVFAKGFKAEDFENEYSHPIIQHFIAYELPLSNLGSNINPNFGIMTSPRSARIAQLNGDNLVFTPFSRDNIDLSKQHVLCELFPEEADNILKGILVQCYNSLGRTGILEILTLLAFYLKNRKQLVDGTHWNYLNK